MDIMNIFEVLKIKITRRNDLINTFDKNQIFVYVLINRPTVSFCISNADIKRPGRS